MKRPALVTLFFLLFVKVVSAQIKEGKVTYSITYPSTDVPASQRALLPSESTIWFRNEQVRMDLNSGPSVSATTITDKSGVTTLMDLMGKKIAFTMTNEEIDKKAKDESAKVKVDYPKETKKIAEYNCHKAVVTMADGTAMTIWLTDELAINNRWNSGFSNLKGFPMEYTLESNGLNMHMTANHVARESVSDEKFNIPAGYEKMTAAELKQLFEGLR